MRPNLLCCALSSVEHVFASNLAAGTADDRHGSHLTRGSSLGFAALLAESSPLGVCWLPRGDPTPSPTASPEAAASARLLSASSLLVFICLGVAAFLEVLAGASAERIHIFGVFWMHGEGHHYQSSMNSECSMCKQQTVLQHAAVPLKKQSTSQAQSAALPNCAWLEYTWHTRQYLRRTEAA